MRIDFNFLQLNSIYSFRLFSKYPVSFKIQINPISNVVNLQFTTYFNNYDKMKRGSFILNCKLPIFNLPHSCVSFSQVFSNKHI